MPFKTLSLSPPPPTPSKGNKCNNIFKGGKLIKINWCRNISFSTKLKTNFIKKVDLLIYNFYYISSEVIKHLIYKKTKPDYFTKLKVPQNYFNKEEL